MKFLIFILLFSTEASGQFIINPYSFSAPIDGLPLNTEGATTGFSLRKIRTAYTGNAVRIRRSTDNVEQDIGFSGTDFDASAFSTFVGAGTGFVTTWYDQGVSGYNATQTTTTAQPEITLSAQNGKAVITFSGTRYLTIPLSVSYFNYLHSTAGQVIIAGKPGIVADPNALYAFLGSTAATTGKTGITIFFDDRTASSKNNGVYVMVTKSVAAQGPIDRTEIDIVTANTFTLINTIVDPDNATSTARLKFYTNNVLKSSSNTQSFAPVTTNATHNMQIGANGFNANIYVGTMAELIIYNAEHATDVRNAVAANINTYYAIY